MNAGRSPDEDSRLRTLLPLFEALADPLTVARLAAEAEEAGWTGVFVWDHLRWCEPISAIADPWITLAVMATATSRIRLGPMVTPLPRRRPTKVAKETVSLDRLSAGRLTFGVGLGSDAYGNEYSKTGEEVDDRKRAAMLDEALEVIIALGQAKRSSTGVSTTPSTECASYPYRFSNPGFRYG